MDMSKLTKATKEKLLQKLNQSQNQNRLLDWNFLTANFSINSLLSVLLYHISELTRLSELRLKELPRCSITKEDIAKAVAYMTKVGLFLCGDEHKQMDYTNILFSFSTPKEVEIIIKKVKKDL